MKKRTSMYMVVVILCSFVVVEVGLGSTPPPLPDYSTRDSWTTAEQITYRNQLLLFESYMRRLGYNENDIVHARNEYNETYIIPTIFARALEGLGPEAQEPYEPFLPYYPTDTTNGALMREYYRSLGKLSDYMRRTLGYSRRFDIQNAITAYTNSSGQDITGALLEIDDLDQRDVELPEVSLADRPVDSDLSDHTSPSYTMTYGDAKYEDISIKRADSSIDIISFNSHDNTFATIDSNGSILNPQEVNRYRANLGANGASRKVYVTSHYRTTEHATDAKNHLSYGFLAMQEENSSGDIIASTAYFGGINPISSSDMAKASGTATYLGETVGTYHDKGTP